MPGEEELRKQLKEQMNTEWIEHTTAVDSHDVDRMKVLAKEDVRVKKASDVTSAEKDTLQKDINLMSNALAMDEENINIVLAPKVKERLKVNKGRKTSQLLLNSTRKIAWWDSDEMKYVKDSVKELEDLLSSEREWELNKENVEIGKLEDDELKAVEKKYEKAIQACRQYLEVKTTKTGTGRYNLVRDKMLSLMDELAEFTSMRAVINAQEDTEWTKVRTYADLLWSFNLNKMVERSVAPKPVSEEVKTNERATKQVEHGIDKETLDPGARLMFDLLCMDMSQSLSVGQEENKLDNIRIAGYLLNILRDLQTGPKAIYFHSAFAGYKGKNPARQYKHNDETKTGHTVFSLIHKGDGKLALKVNGSNSIELPGIQTLIGNIRTQLIRSEENINKLAETEPNKYAKNLGSDFINRVMGYVLKDNYEKNDPPVGFRDHVAYFIQNRYKVDQSRFQNIKNEDLRILVKNIIEKQIDQTTLDRTIARLNNEKYWTDEEYSEKDIKVEDVEKDDEATLNRIKTNALLYLTQVTYMEESMFDHKTVYELHELAMRLIRRETNPDQVKNEIRAQRGGKYYVEVKGDAGKYINSKEARDVLKKWEERDKTKTTVEFKTEEEVQEEKTDEATWTKEESQIKNFISNLIFSGNAAAMDKEVESGQKGAYFKQLVKSDESIGTIALMLKNQELVRSTLEKIPFITDANGFSEKILTIFKSWVVADQLDLTRSEEEIANQIKSVIGDNIGQADAAAEQNLNNLIDSFAQSQLNSIQKVIDEVLKENFGGANKLSKKPESSKEKGVDYEEKEERVKQERAWLTEYLNRHMTTGDEGQAKFLKEVLRHYFGNISSMDQRSVIAFMLREAKPSTKPDEDDKEKQELYLKRSKESCLAGMFKGAGPLLQKTLQGMPTEGIPALLKYAIEDTRSRLLPISPEYVQAQLHDLVMGSDNKITKIEITKSLGAASVGQAFLVKVYGPGMEGGVNHVVKILRPDATYRMEREKAIFEQCAKVVDGNVGDAMQITFQNTYQRIQQELNFENEVSNVNKGKIHYEKLLKNGVDDHVRSMNVSNLTKSNKNVMLIELAPGKTVDKDISDIENEIYEALKEVYKFSDTKKIMGGNDHYKGTPLYFRDVINKLTPVLASAQKKQKNLINLAKKWLGESMFSAEGFYHGDFHAGNIMITEDSVTAIDYGNATSLSSKQQTNLMKLVAMSAGGFYVADKFIAAFEALLYEDNKDENVKSRFNEKREAFEVKVKEILDMGSEDDGILRMSVLAAEAQKLGFPLPAAVANYLQCQIRFQNTIEAYNKLITDMQEAIRMAQDGLSVNAVEEPFSLKTMMNNVLVVAKNDEIENGLKKLGQRVYASWYVKEIGSEALLNKKKEQIHAEFAKKREELPANLDKEKKKEALAKLDDEMKKAENKLIMDSSLAGETEALKAGFAVLLDQMSEADQKAFDDIFLGEDMGDIPEKLKELRNAQKSGADDETITALKNDLIEAFEEDFDTTADVSFESLEKYNRGWAEQDNNPFSHFEDSMNGRFYMRGAALSGFDKKDFDTGMKNSELLQQRVIELNDEKLTKAFEEYKEAVLEIKSKIYPELDKAKAELNNLPEGTEKEKEIKKKKEIALEDEKELADIKVTNLYKKVLLELIRLETPNIKKMKRAENKSVSYSEEAPDTFMDGSSEVLHENMDKLLATFFFDTITLTNAMIKQRQRLA